MGWINADEFVTGLKAAGPNFTRQKVVDATNKLTHYTAGGIVAPIDWTTAHQDQIDCYVVLKVVDGKFKPHVQRRRASRSCASRTPEDRCPRRPRPAPEPVDPQRIRLVA